jgi:hypothetical protein
MLTVGGIKRAILPYEEVGELLSRRVYVLLSKGVQSH